ncbi:kinase-like domain-containing protein [Phakopsora pachyrhizi]|uniref:Kinase-like domain-containing protein n=1 Tax=Phakopsora pachyrhizi TaxID=170000 RepID=A0AAV0AKN9_PHAPC|nr:kinase-like domain-containing protein [Phakopsora pachyrhizi]
MMTGVTFPRHADFQQQQQQEKDYKSTLKFTSSKPSQISELQLLKQIGQGSFGKVWVARQRDCKETGNVLAIKAVQKTVVDPRFDSAKAITSELTSLKRLDRGFPFIAHLRADFSNEKFYFLVLDYASGGDLFEFLNTNGPIDETLCQMYVAELGCALEELHSRRIIFRDLKTENVLICHDGHLKLTDFGLSKVIENELCRTQTICGTPHVMSPEIIKKESYDFKSDWWALGTVMYEMLTGYPLFYEKSGNILTFFHCILHKKINYPKNLTRECKEVLNRLLEKDQSKRLNSLEDLLNLNWFDAKFRNVEALKSKKFSPSYVPKIVDGHQLSKIPADFYHPETDCYILKPISSNSSSNSISSSSSSSIISSNMSDLSI